jgi:hypothetical protein
MFRFKRSHLALLLGLLAPVSSFAASNYCIAVGGGFGSGGSTFIGSGFAVPAAGSCAAWSGFTKAFSSVILSTSGSGCLSSDGKVLTVSLSSADPSFFGPGQSQSDYIRTCPAGVKSCPIGGGVDIGGFGGAAAPVNCTANLLQVPAIHD